MRVHHIVICGLPRSTIFFPHYFANVTIKRTEHENVCFDFVYNFCPTYFPFYEELRKIWSKMYIGLHVKYPLLLSDFNKPWIFSLYFGQILKYKISWKSVNWVPSCPVWTDGRTDWHEEANSRFSQFCERHLNLCSLSVRKLNHVTHIKQINFSIQKAGGRRGHQRGTLIRRKDLVGGCQCLSNALPLDLVSQLEFLNDIYPQILGKWSLQPDIVVESVLLLLPVLKVPGANLYLANG
jgi:hypothetical protein